MASIDFRNQRTEHAKGSNSTAFIIESMLLLIFLIASLAVVVQLFAGSINKATQSLHLERAVIVASNTAEEFSADPKGVPAQGTQNGLNVSCEVTPVKTQAGTLYNATITVSDEYGEIYSMQTARYESGVTR